MTQQRLGSPTTDIERRLGAVTGVLGRQHFWLGGRGVSGHTPAEAKSQQPKRPEPVSFLLPAAASRAINHQRRLLPLPQRFLVASAARRGFAQDIRAALHCFPCPGHCYWAHDKHTSDASYGWGVHVECTNQFLRVIICVYLCSGSRQGRGKCFRSWAMRVEDN